MAERRTAEQLTNDDGAPLMTASCIRNALTDLATEIVDLKKEVAALKEIINGR